MTVRMTITDRDHQVMKFIEDYGSITISQTQMMFYNTQNYGYDIARRRLKKLVGYGKIKVSRDMAGNENVYYTDKKLSYHDLLVLDYYAKIISLGAKKIYFKPRMYWMNNTMISDAFFIYDIGGRVFFNIVEVVRTHGIDKEKYLKLYKDGEPQKYSSAIYEKMGGPPINDFPRVILIDNVSHKKDLFIHKDINIYQLDFGLNNLSRVLM